MSILASCSTSIKFHRWPNGVLVQSVDLNEDDICVRSLSWDKEQKRVIAVPTSGTPLLISFPKGENGDVFTEYMETTRVNAADFSKTQNDLVAFGTTEGKVYLYDISQRKMVETYPSAPNEVHFVEFGFCRDRLLAAGSGQGQIVLYNSKKLICASFVVPHSYSLSCMSFHKKNATLLTAASKEGIVSVWNIENGNMLFAKQNHDSVVSDVDFHPGHKNVFASVGLDKKVVCNDLRMPECLRVETLDNELSALAFMENRFEMAMGTMTGQLLCYDWRNFKAPVCTIIAHEKAVRDVAFQIDYIKEVQEENSQSNNVDNVDSSYIESSSFSDMDSSRTEDVKPIENKIPSGINVENPTNKEVFRQAFEIELDRVAKEIVDELFNLHEKFDNYLSRSFFEMKIEISKKCIVLEEEVGKRIDRLMKTRRRRDADISGTTSRTSILGNLNIADTNSFNKMHNTE